MNANCILLLCAGVVACAIVLWVFPLILKFANHNNIVDNPDERKLQRRPVPVLGGVAVFTGLLVAIVCALFSAECDALYAVFVAMIVMLYVGTMDDMRGLSPHLRLLVEIAVVLLIIFVNQDAINHFYGLFGVQSIPPIIAKLLTVFAAVGIINAINLIDGVDGLSSGFCMMASVAFGGVFIAAENWAMALLAAVSIGALIPFFLHNVFGYSSKMFMGDGGTLVFGVIMSSFVIAILDADSLCVQHIADKYAMIPFTLAVLSVPVFDTLRVMLMRILKGISPFHPDKTHLHHIFIAVGCSHPGTTFMILSLNSMIILGWFLMAWLGASIHQQLIFVIAMGLLVTFGLYAFVSWQINHETKLLGYLQRFGNATHIQRTGVFRWLKHLVDDTLLFRSKHIA